MYWNPKNLRCSPMQSWCLVESCTHRCGIVSKLRSKGWGAPLWKSPLEKKVKEIAKHSQPLKEWLSLRYFLDVREAGTPWAWKKTASRNVNLLLACVELDILPKNSKMPWIMTPAKTGSPWDSSRSGTLKANCKQAPAWTTINNCYY